MELPQTCPNIVRGRQLAYKRGDVSLGRHCSIIMDQIMNNLLVLAIASSCTFCQELPVNYNARSTAGAGVGMCPATQDLTESIKEDIRSLINNSVLPALMAEPRYRACGCGGPGWRRVAYLDMSDPTQTCPPAWELITTPRRSCARPSAADRLSCYSAIYPIQGIQYSQVCGRIIGYQIGEPQAFVLTNVGRNPTIDRLYVDGVSLTYGNPRKHIWTFAAALDEAGIGNNSSRCTCTDSSRPNTTPSFVGNDYFCETGVPPGQRYNNYVFYADDPLWDGQDCGPTSTCCTFNNPPWFCKQLPQSTNADLEIRLCSYGSASVENTPVELIEIYTM